MARIAVDIDDTLYSFGQLAREMFVEVALERGNKKLQRGAYCAWGEWRSPADVTDDEDFWPYVIERCHTSSKIKEQTPFPHAARTLWELVDQGYELMYISNRSPEAHDATLDWLIDHNFPYYKPHALVCTMEDKRKYLRNCQYLIDDRPKTLVQFVYDYDWKNKYGSNNGEKARKGFGIFGEYNRSLTDVPGIWLAPNWKLLRHYLVEKGVLNESVGAGVHYPN